MLLADEEADRVAVDHGAGRGAVEAELRLDPRRSDRVPARRPAVVGGEHLRHEEERDSGGARRRIGKAGEDQVDDVVGEVVLAIGDEDLLAADPVRTVGGAFRSGADRAEIGAGCRPR